MKVNVFWFRRDLRLHDNHGLFRALSADLKVLPIFIFDTDILDKLEDKRDARVVFIYESLQKINLGLNPVGSCLLIRKGNPQQVFSQLIQEFDISKVFVNEDYEPDAKKRDAQVEQLLRDNGIEWQSYTDHVIFKPGEILKPDGTPYTVYTPFSKKWKQNLRVDLFAEYSSQLLKNNFVQQRFSFPNLNDIGFLPSAVRVSEPNISSDTIRSYAENRNLPALQGTSLAGPHLRFGTMSIRQLIRSTYQLSETYLNELIWREFFIHIMVHFPHSVTSNFNAKYNRLEWRNQEMEFKRWCEGTTGYPLVDAGMRELNATGNMHNRVRMIVAGFLTKHLLIDWRWGEAYFASKLLDFELASNVGNWQWAAGTGCDAAPYFRVFNPSEQLRKFDPKLTYASKWVPEMNQLSYLSSAIVEHSFARNRAISTYKKALDQN